DPAWCGRVRGRQMATSGGAELDPAAAVVRERERKRREQGPATAPRRLPSKGRRWSARWGRGSVEGRRGEVGRRGARQPLAGCGAEGAHRRVANEGGAAVRGG